MAERTVFQKIKHTNNFPRLPQVMLHLVKALNSEDATMEELTGIISTDPSLASRLMQIIGSPYINLPKEVNSIKTAVVYLGVDTIRNLAISMSAMHFFNFSKPLSGFDIRQFWYHSYKCGVIARKIAEETRDSNPDEFFLAGLLHDIGRLILMQNFPDDYQTILAAASTEAETIRAEMDLFDTDTPQVSAWLFNQWNLNPLISDAVLFINEDVEQIQGALSHVKTVFISNCLSDKDSIEKIETMLPLTDIPRSRLEQIVITADEEVSEMARTLGINPDEADDFSHEKKLTTHIKDLSLFYGTLQNLLYARDIDAVLDIAHNGLKIVFNVPRMFFFLLDEKKNILTGHSPANDKSHKIIKSIALPVSNKLSLLTRCLKEKKIQNSLDTAPGDKLSISDSQIIRLLGTGGMYCIPIYSARNALGVMALGVDEMVAGCLDDDQGLVELFSKQTGICMESIRFHKNYAVHIHEKKMEAYTTLTDKVIHEINNPLTIIKNYIETLSLKLPAKHPVQEELSVISQELTRTSGLMDKLRSFSNPKIEGFEAVDINKLCQGMLEILKKSILLPRQIESSINIDPAIPEVRTDPNSLKQVFINLIKNAAEAMGEGGKISVTTRFLPESAKIMIDEKKRISGSIEIVISDNGPGISNQIKETLFDPYVTTKIGGANSGLGLSIVHSIVKELNGSITCKTKQGKGTRFIVTLPVNSSKKT